MSKHLSPSKESLSQFDYGSTRFDAKIPYGVTLEDVLQPDFWAHHAKDLRPFDEIRVRADDGTWAAYLIVLDCARTWAKVHVLSQHNLVSEVSVTSEAEVKAFIESHEVRHSAGRKWHIIRKSDRAVMSENIEQKEEAVAWLDKHAREQIGSLVRVAA